MALHVQDSYSAGIGRPLMKNERWWTACIITVSLKLASQNKQFLSHHVFDL